MKQYNDIKRKLRKTTITKETKSRAVNVEENVQKEYTKGIWCLLLLSLKLECVGLEHSTCEVR